MPTVFLNSLLRLICLLALLGSTGCSLFVSSAGNKLAANLSHSIKSQQDPTTVKQALPAYLLMLDAMIGGDPENSGLLSAAAKLNSSYGSLFVTDVSRKKIIAEKALNYASKSLCLQIRSACGVTGLPFEKFKTVLSSLDKDNIAPFYTLASAWAGWIQANSDDWNAVAQLSRIDSIMQRILALDETYDNGNVHLYLGILATVVPPAMGGRIDVAKAHFEKAISISNNKNLIAKVYYAERYARQVFDRKLHDTLLNQVINTKIDSDELALSNSIAKRKARELLESANDYF